MCRPPGGDRLRGVGALAGLGLKESVVTYKDDDDDDEDAAKVPLIGLGLESILSLTKKSDAAYALSVLEESLKTVRDIYKEMTAPPEEDDPLSGAQAPAYLQKQLANFQAGLFRLTGGAGSTTSLFASRQRTCTDSFASGGAAQSGSLTLWVRIGQRSGL